MGARPQPRIHSRSGRFTRSKDFPAALRQRLRPGEFQCVKARSIQPSLLKSKATAPIVGPGISLDQGRLAVKAPSRGFKYMSGDFFKPVTTRSIARSLLISLPIAAIEGALAARFVCAVQSVNVPLPLLRQRTFPGLGVSSAYGIPPLFPPTGMSIERVT